MSLEYMSPEKWSYMILAVYFDSFKEYEYYMTVWRLSYHFNVTLFHMLLGSVVSKLCKIGLLYYQRTSYLHTSYIDLNSSMKRKIAVNKNLWILYFCGPEYMLFRLG